MPAETSIQFFTNSNGFWLEPVLEIINPGPE